MKPDIKPATLWKGLQHPGIPTVSFQLWDSLQVQYHQYLSLSHVMFDMLFAEIIKSLCLP